MFVHHTSLVTGIELEDSLFVGVSQHLSREAQYRRCLANSRHAGDDDVGHVAILGNDFESFDGLGVAHDIVKVDGAILFHPVVS